MNKEKNGMIYVELWINIKGMNAEWMDEVFIVEHRVLTFKLNAVLNLQLVLVKAHFSEEVG